MNEAFRRLANNLLESGKDLLPIVIVIAFFQIAVLQRPLIPLASPTPNAVTKGTVMVEVVTPPES